MGKDNEEIMADNRHKTEILADARTPGELVMELRELEGDAFPVLIKLNNEGFHLHDRRDTSLFSLGLMCGAKLQLEMLDLFGDG